MDKPDNKEADICRNIKELYPQFFKPKKLIRDLVHGYIGLTSFDMDIIDTPHFQRLKDIRQLTCQQVFPGARHTRFEHSLGVLELTRQAIKHLNINGYLPPSTNSSINPICPKLEFNACMAALLHDVGHCPFSHLGEEQFKIEDVCENLKQSIILHLNGISQDVINKIDEHKSSHEMLSCIILLNIYHDKLILCEFIDFEFIIRCILGIEYTRSPKKIENLLINLISSDSLDMDKLDYIMRDSLYTGISVPDIDTNRIFNNMFISDQGRLIFDCNAVPALQNIIETRDNLYIWVYNHHAVVYTDFLYSYIMRRLMINYENIHGIKYTPSDNDPSWYGCLPNDLLFSVDAIEKRLVSDSDLNYYLKDQYRKSKEFHSQERKLDKKDRNMVERIAPLLKQLFERQLLKPWWKTIFEYSNFMKANFPDDNLRRNIPRKICDEKEKNQGSEFRSQIAKAILNEFKESKEGELCLKDGEIFIVQRSNKFYSLQSISKITIYFKKNEILNNTIIDDTTSQSGDYYTKYLTNIIPQRDYSTFFTKESFYIYIKRISGQEKEARAFYEKVEKKFIEFSTNLAKLSSAEFDEYADKMNRREDD